MRELQRCVMISKQSDMQTLPAMIVFIVMFRLRQSCQTLQLPANINKASTSCVVNCALIFHATK